MRLFTLFLAVLLIGSNPLFSQQDKEVYTKEKIMEKYGNMLNQVNNLGTNYWVSVPPAYIEFIRPGDFIKLFIISPVEQVVTLSSPQGYNKQVTAKKWEATEVNLTPGEGQPYVYSYTDGSQETKVVDGKAINVVSEQPIVLYCVVRYYATSDGFLCIPTPALGNRYVASPYSSRPISDNSLPNMVTVVAPYNATEINFTVGGNLLTRIPIEGGPTLEPGDSYEWVLNKGDVLVLTNEGNNQTLSGSLIEANKPIAVVSGHYCADIPVGNTWCDYNAEMDIPLQAWGQHYHVPLVRNRSYPSLLRIFAKEDNTRIYRDGREIAVINDGGGGIENEGWYETRVWPYLEGNGDIALISGDKPIYVMMYNPGILEDQQAGSNSNSDPFAMLISPIEQYQNEIIFATPGATGGNPFGENYLNIVYEADENGIAPDDLEFGQYNGNGFNTIPMRNIGGAPQNFFYMANSTDDFINSSPFANKIYQHKPHSLPSVGTYRVKGPLPFAVYSYGYASYDSYGFPTSTAVANLEIDDPDAPTAFWEIDCEGVITGGKITEQPQDQQQIVSGIFRTQVISSQNFEPLDFYDSKLNEFSKVNSQLFKTRVIDKTQYAEIVFMALDQAGNSATFREEYYPEEYDFYAEVGEPGDKYYENYNDGVPYDDGMTDTEYFIIENTSEERDLEIEDLYMKFGTSNFEFVQGSFELDGALLDPQPNVPLNGNVITVPVGSQLRFGVEFSSTDANAFNEDSLGIETCTYDREYSVLVEARKGGPRISAVDPNPFPFHQIDGTLPQQPELAPRTFRIKNGCPNGDGTTPLTIVAIDGPVDPQFRTDIENFLPIEILPGEESQEFQVWFRSNGTSGDFTDRITFLTDQDEPLEDCKNYVDLEASAGNTQLEAQGYNFAAIDLYEFIQNGQQAVMADDSQSDYAPITVKNITQGENGFGVDLNGGVVTAAAGSEGKFFFDDAVTQALDDDATFDNALTVNLAAGEIANTRNVYFSPDATGNFSINYKVTGTSDQGNEVESPEYEINGSAYVANLAIYKVAANEDASDIEYETVVYPNVPATQTFEITNTRYDGEYEFGNTAVFSLDLGDISYDANASDFVIQDVRFADGTPYTGPNLDQPNLTLDPGRTLVVTVAYTGNYNNGDVNETTISITDHNTLGDGAVIENTGPWNDELTFRAQLTNITSIAGADDFPPTCVGNTTLLNNGEFFIENNSANDNPFEVTGLTFDAVNGNNGGFELNIEEVYLVDRGGVRNALGAIDLTANPQTLEQGERLEFDVSFTPNVEFNNPREIQMIAQTNIDETDGINSAPEVQTFQIETFTQEKNIVIRNVTGEDVLKIGENVQVALALEGNQDISNANITELQGSISYRRGYLVADYNSLELAPQYQGDFELIYNPNTDVSERFQPSDKPGKDEWIRTISFTIRATGGTPFNANGDIVTLDFEVFLGALSLDALPEGRDESNVYIAQRVGEDDFTVEIDGTLNVASENSCANLNQPDAISVSLADECAYEYRTISTTGSNNSDAQISRTPVTSVGADLEFELALDGKTTIKIFDTNGNQVATIYDGELNHGEHSFDIPVNDLSNGVYLFEVKSDFYYSTDKFVISK